MKDFAQNYIKTYEGLSKIVKLLLCLLWDIPSNLYRFSKSVKNDNTLGMVLAIVIAIFGGWILFVIDILTLAFADKIYWLDELGLEEATAKVGKSENATENAQSEDNATADTDAKDTQDAE